MTTLKLSSWACALLLPLAPLAGCEEEGPFERAGERADQNVEKAGDDLEETADELEDDIDDMTDSNP